jgi:hypothetical protein
MKRIIAATLLVMLFTGVCFAEEPQAEIVFDKSTHNFGTFSEDNPVQTCTFTFKNTGKAPLVIVQAIATCGCTVPTYTDKPVPPGETGIIQVTYNGKGRYPGHFKKVITVNTNAKQRLVRLTIEGEMVAKSETNK